jgi:mono/diheme cytochrome c family protein
VTASMRRRAGRLAAVLAVGVASVGLTACGGSGETADLAAGKTTFVNLCSSCHTLADSGAKPAYIGPNFDDAWRASRQVGIEDSQFAGTIERWIRIAQLPMPRNLVKGQDAENVAAYIASVAGTTPDSGVFPASSTPEVPNPPRQDQE